MSILVAPTRWSCVRGEAAGGGGGKGGGLAGCHPCLMETNQNRYVTDRWNPEIFKDVFFVATKLR